MLHSMGPLNVCLFFLVLHWIIFGKTINVVLVSQIKRIIFCWLPLRQKISEFHLKSPPVLLESADLDMKLPGEQRTRSANQMSIIILFSCINSIKMDIFLWTSIEMIWSVNRLPFWHVFFFHFSLEIHLTCEVAGEKETCHTVGKTTKMS